MKNKSPISKQYVVMMWNHYGISSIKYERINSFNVADEKLLDLVERAEALFSELGEIEEEIDSVVADYEKELERDGR